MLLYFFLLDGVFYHEIIGPALARSHRQRSFAPCHDLCWRLLARNPGIPQDALIRVAAGLKFDRAFWHSLIGECLVHGATDIPRLPTAPASLCCLLAPDHYARLNMQREHYAPILQAHLGARDVTFGGGYYRPDHAGLNDKGDVARLAAYLEAIDPATWQPRDLARLADCHNDEECAEELAYVRDWWPDLVELYQKARDQDMVVVCETVE
jgi:hypothetical protein